MKLFVVAVLAIMSLFTTTAMAGPALRLWVKSASKVTISELYIRRMATDDWGAERLRGKHLEPKGKMQFMLEDGVDKCWVDLRMLSMAGKEYAYYAANLCEEGHTFTFRGRP
ncbi:hypothetical protein VW23_027965 [Devosia insulae DS-56]|uniref:Uncharacterized protein n=1 Tax=Devosia insulae DS-56 TaxID=1116389 RepID=A0A1E5XJZ7_9HYPH|nr:hypothetical protein [Devosia insulae]OEO28918.1 hypothetical protein VW23_027965 [Devosia insulae DS-56]